MYYLYGTRYETSFLGAINLYTMYTPIDVSYATHDNCKSHTGGASTYGIGIVSMRSSKQKLNTTNTTESELVGISNCLPKVLSHQRFMEQQGYPIEDNVILQDNKSTILIAENGIKSCSKRSRYIKIWYFFIKDLIDSREVRIEYCPTEKMLADFFSKLLQGSLFR